jgi:integrase
MVNVGYRKRKKAFVSYTLFALSQPEITRLLAACDNPADHIMIVLAYRYGFRRDDLSKVKVANIDFVNSTLTFYDHKKDKDRTIPIEPDVLSELKRYKSTLAKKQVYLLPFNDPSTLWVHLQDLCAAAGIPVPPGRTGRPFHSLRGTCVKFRQAQGWTVSQVAALIGDTPETVLKHYATVTTHELSEKMNGATV